MDAVVLLTHLKGEPTIHVTLDKSRHAETRKLGTCRRRKVRLGINDVGEEVTSVRIEWATEGEAAPRDYPLFMDVLRDLTNVSGPTAKRKDMREGFRRELAYYVERNPNEDVSLDPHRMNEKYRRCEAYATTLRLIRVNSDDDTITYLFGGVKLPAPPATA